MPDPSPVALRKLLALRQFPVFASADLGELAVVADYLSEHHYAAGATVTAPATHVSALHLVLDGRIELRQRMPGEAGLRVRTWTARQAFGTLEVLARRPLGSEAIAVVDTRTLRLRSADLRDVLEDNFSVLAAILRELAVRLAAHDAPHATAPFDPALIRSSPLDLVERMILLRRQMPLLASRLEPLATLAHAAQEQRWPAGMTIGRSGDRARETLVILDGEVALTRDGAPPRTAGAGAALGVLETLGGLCHRDTLTAATATRALRIPSATLFDVLEQHSELAMSVVSTFAGWLLDAPRGPEPFTTRELARSLEWPMVAAHKSATN